MIRFAQPPLLGLAAALAACLFIASTGARAEVAKFLFGAEAAPSPGAPAPIGSYAKGCLVGGVELPETGWGWQAMRLSRNRNWGHPVAIAFIERLAAEGQTIGWPGLYIGDISQPRGGPMRSGHRSHQIGLDIDIWLRLPDRLALTRREREQIGSARLVTADRLSVTGGWTPLHHDLLKAAARDPAVARIFVNAAIKAAMCRDEPAAADRSWLRKIRPWWGHDAHFHVRLACPPGAVACVDQAPPPAGDGCGEELAWWFTQEALNPTPSGGPRKEIQLADLPAACAPLVGR